MGMYEYIQQASILGLNRGDVIPDAAYNKYDIPIDQNVEDRFLQLLVFSSAQRKTSFIPQSSREERPSTSPSKLLEIEGSLAWLSTILSETGLPGLTNEGRSFLLGEYLRVLSKEKKVIPAPYLPAILDVGKYLPELKTYFPEVLGVRGFWLAEQNKEWQYMPTFFTEEKWETGSFEERKAYLIFLREGFSEKGLKVLKSTWDQESLKEKLAFLECLSVNISLKDESFLLQQLEGAGQKLAYQIRQLLVKIPEGAYVAELDKEAAQCIVKPGNRRKQKFEFFFPEDFRFGKRKSRALAIEDFVSLISPDYWESCTGLKEKAIIDSAISYHESEPLVKGLIRAAYLHQKQEWIKYLSFLWIYAMDKAPRWMSIFTQYQFELTHGLSEADFNELIIKRLRNKDYSLSYTFPPDPIVSLLTGCIKPWSDRLAMLIVVYLQQAIELNNRSDQYVWELILNKASFLIKPTLFTSINNKLTDVYSPVHEPAVNQFLMILRKRAQFLNS